MRIERTHLGHYAANTRVGSGFDLWPHDSGDGVFMLAFFPGPVWLEGGNARFNPLTRATDMDLGWRDLDGAVHLCGQVRLTVGANGAIVASFVIENGPPGISSFADTFTRLVGNAAPGPLPPTFPPPPPPPEPPVEPLPPIVPVPPVIPPGVALNPISTSWLELFGSEFGQSGWRLDPPRRLNNSAGICDVLCIAFRAPTAASGFHYGRFTHDNAGGGAVLQWLSRVPADLSLAQDDPKAWVVGDLGWELLGTAGHPTQDRVQLEPGAVYYLNAAFVSGALITDERLEPSGTGGDYALTATQLS